MPLLRDKYDDLGGWPSAAQLPVVYDPSYNISFWGLENLHPFDSKKFQRVLALLEGRGVLTAAQLVAAHEAGHAALREVHAERYLRRLDSSSFYVAQAGDPWLAWQEHGASLAGPQRQAWRRCSACREV